jgi:hypothetical protein
MQTHPKEVAWISLYLSKIKFVDKNLPDMFTSEFYQTFKEEIILFIQEHEQNMRQKGKFPLVLRKLILP